MRKIFVLLTIAAVLASGAVAAQAAITKTVSWKIGSRTTVIIKRGDTVKWIWRDSKPHDVRGPGLRTSIKTRSRASKTFRSRGTFAYICSVHSSMKTTVRVR